MLHVRWKRWDLTMAGCLGLAMLAGCCHCLGPRRGQPPPDDGGTACAVGGHTCGEAIYQTSPQFFPVPTRPVFSSRVADARDEVLPYLPGAAAPIRQPRPVRLPATNPTPEEMPAPMPQPPTSLDADPAAPIAATPIQPDGSSWLFSPRVPDAQLKTLDPTVVLKNDTPAKPGAH